MSKPYLVIAIDDGEVGQVFVKDTWDEAVNTAFRVAKTLWTVKKKKFLQDINDMAKSYSRGCYSSVQIAQWEDDEC